MTNKVMAWLLAERDGEYSGQQSRRILLPNIDVRTQEEMNQALCYTSVRLGFGKYGCVIKACIKRNLNYKVAIKQVSIAGKGRRAAKEVTILRKIQQFPYIVTTFRSFQCNDYLYIVMEVALGDLEEVLHRVRGHGLKEDFCSLIARHILLALDYLHHAKFIHRDICPGNILVFPHGICKLGGFGEACSKNRKEAKGYFGTPSYMAPEVKFPKMDEWGRDRYYTETVDIWSLGCVILESFMGRPFLRITREDLNFYSRAGICQPYQISDTLNISEHFSHFLDQMLDIRPEMRPAASVMKYHRFVADTYSSTESIGQEFVRILTLNNIPIGLELYPEMDPKRFDLFAEPNVRSSAGPALIGENIQGNICEQFISLLCPCERSNDDTRV